MRINHNIASLNTYRQLTGNTTSTSKSLEKLSSGLRINRAGDDAAGLAISEKMRGQIRGLDQASSNAQDGISLLQTAEGALNETHSILQRMRELAVQSATDTNTASDRAEIQKEVDQLATELTRIANDTEFNTQKLLNGGVKTDALGESTFHIGANAGQSLNVSINAMDAFSLGVARDATSVAISSATNVSAASISSGTRGSALVSGRNIAITVAQGTDSADTAVTFTSGTDILTLQIDDAATSVAGTGIFAGFSFTTSDITNAAATIAPTITVAGDAAFAGGVKTSDAVTEAGIDVSTKTTANSAITKIETAITTVSAERSKLGAVQNRLEHTINNLSTSSENLTASESRIRDVDMAKEMMSYTKNNILTQAATAMLAQANQQPQGVLQLLQ